MAIGGAVTNKFSIGSAEIRVGALSEANNLTSDHSLGLLNSSNVTVTQEKIDVLGGLYKSVIDSVTVSTSVTIDAQIYEFSRKNLRIALNEGVEIAPPPSYSGKVMSSADTQSALIDTDVPLSEVQVGDLVVIYLSSAPEKLSLLKVTSVAASTVSGNEANAAIGIDPSATPLLYSVAAGDFIYKTNQVKVGGRYDGAFFTLDVVGLDHTTGQPNGFKFWKVSVEGGLDYSFSNDAFAVSPLRFKVMEPTPDDLGPGGSLERIAGLVVDHPYGLMFHPSTDQPNDILPNTLFDVLGSTITDSLGSPITTTE